MPACYAGGMRGVTAIVVVLAVCAWFADAASARSKTRRSHHAHAIVSDRAPGADTGKDAAVSTLDRVLNTRIKSICRGC
jgi:hypothetical protein